MASQRRRPGRQVGVKDGKKLFASACGGNTCNQPNTYLDGRLVSVASDGKKVFAVASECCQPPTDPATAYGVFDGTCNDAAAIAAAVATMPFMVERDHWPPYGLSRVIRVTLHAEDGCTEHGCKTAYLIYTETPAALDCTGEAIPTGHGAWVGCVGPLDIVLWVTDDDPPVVRVCVSGCVTGTPLDTSIGACTLGVNFDVIGQILADGLPDCCEQVTAEPRMEISGRTFCGPYRQARFVGVRADGKRVFAFGDCCEPEPECVVTVTLECDGEPPATFTVPTVLTASFPDSLSGIGDVTLTYDAGLNAWLGTSSGGYDVGFTWDGNDCVFVASVVFPDGTDCLLSYPTAAPTAWEPFSWTSSGPSPTGGDCPTGTHTIVVAA